MVDVFMQQVWVYVEGERFFEPDGFVVVLVEAVVVSDECLCRFGVELLFLFGVVEVAVAPVGF